MATITRSTMPDLLWPGIQAIFGTSYDKLDKEYTRIFDVRKSTKAYEKVTEATGLGLAAVKAEGASIIYDSPNSGPASVFTHVTYGLGYIMTREAEEDNQYQQVAEANAAALPWSMLTTKEIVHANVLNRAFNTSYLGGDGQPLVSGTHATANGTQSNLLTAADLSEAALEDALTRIAEAKNSAGLPIALRAVRLIVGPGQIFNATRILESEGRSGTQNNDANAIKTLGLVPEIVINHYLDDPDAWYLQTNAPNGLISYQRRALALEKDNDFDTENRKHKATERYSAGWGDPRAIYASAGA
ncbi:MAG: Mu-like prophage major head subunit gpT family protein [Pseudomonadota bacterium]